MSRAMSTCSSSVGWPSSNSFRRPAPLLELFGVVVGEADQLEHGVGREREGQLVHQLGPMPHGQHPLDVLGGPAPHGRLEVVASAGWRSPSWCTPGRGHGRAACCSTSPAAGRSRWLRTSRAAGHSGNIGSCAAGRERLVVVKTASMSAMRVPPTCRARGRRRSGSPRASARRRRTGRRGTARSAGRSRAAPDSAVCIALLLGPDEDAEAVGTAPSARRSLGASCSCTATMFRPGRARRPSRGTRSARWDWPRSHGAARRARPSRSGSWSGSPVK